MSKIRIENHGAVRTITLTRGDKRNAIDGEMMAALLAAFKALPGENERVTVLRAEGSAFCAGLDLRERKDSFVELSGIEDIFYAVENYPLPVVAVVQGAAIAGGCELALHCDFVVASSAAVFGMSLSQIGLAPSWFLAKKLLEVAGPVTARQILLLGEPVPAARMHHLGVITALAEPDELDAVAKPLIERLAANAPLSMIAIKAVLVREMKFRDGVYHEDVDKLVRAASSSQDALEGITARLEKRAPNFKGE